MSDILTRLRAPMNRGEFFKVANGLCMDAAIEIDRLTRELAEAQKDRDYWKVEAEGEAARVAFRDDIIKDLKEKSLMGDDEYYDRWAASIANAVFVEFKIDVIARDQNRRLRAAIARALKEKP